MVDYSKFIDYVKKMGSLYEASSIVDSVDKELKKYVEQGVIDSKEQDALRHYYGTLELAKEYGPSMSWFLGQTNEGIRRNTIGAQKDLYNNDIALDMFSKGNAFDLNEISNPQDIRKPLNYLKIPAPEEDYQ